MSKGTEWMSCDSEKYLWHDVFITGIAPEGIKENEARSMAHCAWGLCLAGATPPKNFGKGMVELTKLYPSITDIALSVSGRALGRNK